MRLIDVDEFLEKEGERIEMQGKEQSYYSVPFLLSQSEVDAIPIDYLLKESTEMVFKKEMSGDDMQKIYRIIAKWRKENEVIG